MSEPGPERKQTPDAGHEPRAKLGRASSPVEANYRRIFENARDGILQTAPDGRILIANPALARIFGYESVGEFMRAVPNALGLYADAAKRAELLQRLQEHGSVVDFEVEMLRRDGNPIWTSSSIHTVRDEHGTVHYEGRMEDVTDRKRAALVMEESSSGALRHHRATVWTEIAILIGLTVLVYFVAARFDWFEALTGWVLRNRGVDQMDELVVTAVFLLIGLLVFALRRWRESEAKVTSQRHTQAALRVLHDELDYRVKQRTAELREANEALRTEATERTRAEGVLRLQSAALTATATAIVITDRDGAIVWANPAFSTFTGYTLAEARGHNPRELVKSGNQDPAVYDQLWSTILAGGVWQGELVNRRKDGSLYPEGQTITPVRDAKGEITHFIAIKQDLTERKQVDEMVQASRRQFQAVFEQASVGMVIAGGARGHFLNVNRRFCEIVGYTADELRHLSSHDITHPDDIAADTDHLQQISSGAIRDFSRDKRYRKKDGSDVWVRVFVAPLDPSEPQPTVRIGVIEDITEHKQTQEALRKSEEGYRSLFERATDGIFSVAPDGLITSLNPAFERITGWPPAEWFGRPFHELIHPEDQPRAQKLFNAAQRLEHVPMAELRVRTKTGQFRDIEFTGFSSPLPDGRVEVQGIGRDVTDRKRVDRLMREQNDILSNSHEGVMIVDLHNQVLLWNTGSEEIFGWTAAEAVEMSPEKLLGADELGAIATLRAAVERDGFWSGELRAQTRDGSKRIVSCRTTLVRNEAGQPRARISFIADITEQKLLEEKFLHAQRLESIGMLAAGIAHDLNNVLAPIMFAAPMLRDSLSDERDLRILNTLEQCAGRGAGLVKQILGFAHATSGEFRPTQVKHLARDIVGVIEETFPKSIQLKPHIPSELWAVLGNPTQIHQVLLNLCVNARDAMPDGGTLVVSAANRRLDAAEAATIPGARPGAWLVLEVSDTGTGIAPEVLERIWTPFFTTKGVGKGTGLGLSTVRGLVASHHGFVDLQTAVGHGSTFRVYLPAVVDAEPSRSDGASPSAPPHGNGELILVADDDAAIRDIVTTILRQQNYRVVNCADGLEAFNAFNAHLDEISLVVTDVDMPRLGGVGLARALLEARPDIRLLAMSGLSHNDAGGSDIPAIRELAHGFLLKPFTSEDLLGTVHRLIHSIGSP